VTDWSDSSAALAVEFARLADDKQAADIVVLNLVGLTSFADYFVIATARNERHLISLADEFHSKAKGQVTCLSPKTNRNSRWVLLDYGSVIVHIFSADARQYYDLDQFWGDAPRICWRRQEPGTGL